MTPTLRSLALGLFLAFGILFILTTFVPYPPARDSASEFFAPEVIDLGLRHSYERLLIFWAATGVELLVLMALAFTPFGRRLADALLGRCGWFWTVAVVVLVVAAAHELAQWPFRTLRYAHSSAWGMTTQDFGSWLRDQLVMSAITLAVEIALSMGLYLLLRWLPRTWWIWAALGSAAAAVAFAFLLPLYVAPLFNQFTPLGQTEWAHLEPRIRKIIEAAEVPVGEILVMDASRQGKHTNAYFTGFGSSRRIVLYDTLLKNHDAEGIESVLGHELGHWRHQHIVQGILFGFLAALLGLAALDRLLRAVQGKAPWRLQSIADPAGIPLVALLMFLASWAILPLENGISRAFERQADDAALELAGNPEAFIRAEKRLAEENKSNVAPSPWNVWLFSSHPPAVERIRRAIP